MRLLLVLAVVGVALAACQPSSTLTVTSTCGWPIDFLVYAAIDDTPVNFDLAEDFSLEANATGEQGLYYDTIRLEVYSPSRELVQSYPVPDVSQGITILIDTGCERLHVGS